MENLIYFSDPCAADCYMVQGVAEVIAQMEQGKTFP